jgi:hypothetical protein
MAYEEQVLKMLEEIKQALKHIYGEGEDQDDLITSIERSIKSGFQLEIGKLQREIAAINTKLNSLPKLVETLTTLSKTVERLDLGDMKSDIDRIRNQLVNFEAKLTSIDRKVS